MVLWESFRSTSASGAKISRPKNPGELIPPGRKKKALPEGALQESKPEAFGFKNASQKPPARISPGGAIIPPGQAKPGAA